MNREIKFRAWTESKMIYSDLSGFIWAMGRQGAGDFSLEEEIGKELAAFRDEEVEKSIMQFIGLKDKNGIDIYEGDIVRGLLLYKDSEDGTLPTMGVVEYCEGYAAFCLGNDAGQTLFYHHLIKSFEVIGNIYQNPDLL